MHRTQRGRGLGTGQVGREGASSAFPLRMCIPKDTKEAPTPISTSAKRGLLRNLLGTYSSTSAVPTLPHVACLGYPKRLGLC